MLTKTTAINELQLYTIVRKKKFRSLDESSERTLVGKFVHLAGRTGDILGLYRSPIVHVSSHGDDKQGGWKLENKGGG